MILDHISPYIRVAMDNHVEDKHWFIKERALFDYELLYVMSGSVLVTVEGGEIVGNSGDLFLFRPGQRHSILKIGDEPLRQPHIHFDLFYQTNSPDVKVSFKRQEDMSEEERAMIREDVLEKMPIVPVTHLRLHYPVVIEKMIFEIINEFQMKMPLYEIKTKGLLIQLWIQLLRENYWSQNPHVLSNLDDLMQILNYLKHNLQRQITLEELSKMSGISKHYLIRIFKKSFGMAPIQYHQMLRIEKARKLIQFTDDPLTVIAEKVGYPNIHSFSRAFKKLDGMAPSYYKRR